MAWKKKILLWAAATLLLHPLSAVTDTDTPTPVDTDTVTATASDSPTPADTDTFSPTPSDSPTATPSDSPSATPLDTPTLTPSPTSTPSSTPFISPTPTPLSGTLMDAVDNYSYPVSSLGTAWFYQTTTSFFGGDAARSGAISNNGSTTMTISSVAGPGTLSFYWMVSSEAGYDFLKVYVDGVDQGGAISGTLGWTLRSLAIASGTHLVSFTYAKDVSLSAGMDAGFVDQVVFTSAGTPTFTRTPTASPTVSPTFSASPSFSVSPTISDTFTISPTFSPSPSFSVSPTISITSTMSPTPSATRTPLPNNLPADVEQPSSQGFATGGGAPWMDDYFNYYFGGDSARAGAVGNNASSWMETTLSGPGTLSFYWEVSSQYGCDFLSVAIDGSVKDSISGSNYWQRKEYNIPPGNHVVRWTYAKDGAGLSGSDTGWVDQMSFVSRAGALKPGKLTSYPNPLVSGGYSIGNVSFMFDPVGQASLQILDWAARVVRDVPASSVFADQGYAVWDGKTNAGAYAAPGMYFALLRTDKGSLNCKLTVVWR